MAAIKTDNSKCMSWIHCNSCFSYYDESDRFYLINCMHIFCYECLNKRGESFLKNLFHLKNKIQLKFSVITNNNKCCFCKKTVKYKKIDKSVIYQSMRNSISSLSKRYERFSVGRQTTRRLRSRSFKGIRLLSSINGTECATDDSSPRGNPQGRETGSGVE